MLVSSAMQTPLPPEAAKEIDYVKSLVARHFPVYDVNVSYDIIEFFCRIDESTLEESFDELRKEMLSQGYVPMITYQKGEHVIIVGKRGRLKRRSPYVSLILFAVTLLMMTYFGAALWSSYIDPSSADVFSLDSIGMGILTFVLPLMTILGAHELGHYWMARRKGVAVSFPLFLPLFPLIGTFGAIVSFRDPVPDRKSLLEIGITGPIVGLLVAIPIGVLGILLTNADGKPIPDEFTTEASTAFYLPLLYEWIAEFVPIAGDYATHPLIFAAWAGFLLTAINLLPAGQLDGGLIARSLLGRNARFVSWATVGALFALTFLWMFWIILLLVILLLGLTHPPPLNDIIKLDFRRKIASLCALVIFIFTFLPIPTTTVIPDHSIEIEPAEGMSASISPWDSAEFTFHVINAGSVKNNITVFAENQSTAWMIEFKPIGTSDGTYADSVNMALNVSQNITYSMRVTCGSVPPGERQLTVVARSESAPNDEPVEERLAYTLTVEPPHVQFWIIEGNVSAPAGGNATAFVQVNNTRPGDLSLDFATSTTPDYVNVTLYEHHPDENSTDRLEMTIPADDSVTLSVLISVNSSASPGDWAITIQASYFDFALETMEVGFAVV